MNNHTPVKVETQTEMFDRIAKQAGKTTIMQTARNGGVLVWVTKDEADPFTALMAVALGIMVRRGITPNAASGITIRRVTEMVAPGCEVYWSVHDTDGKFVGGGYVANEQDAAVEIAKHVKPKV